MAEQVDGSDYDFADGWLTAFGYHNFHIDKVEVFTGNDSYEETACLEMKVDNTDVENPSLSVKERKIPCRVPSKLRIRNEPGVRLYFREELSDKQFCLRLGHHKGCLISDLILLDGTIKEFKVEDKT